jgi:hypothetical protein
LILLGTFQMHWNWSAWAATGVILSACYLLWSYQRVFFGEVTVEKNRTLPDASAREKWILAVMAVITLWMGIGSPYFTRRFAAPSQNVLDQMQRNFPQDASTSRHTFGITALSSGHELSRAATTGKATALAAEGLALPSANVAAADFRGRLASTPAHPTAAITQIVIPSAARDPLLPFRSAQQPTTPERLTTRP